MRSMAHIILCMSEKQGRLLSDTFRRNYPNYTIDFAFSKDLPENRTEIERNGLWICDRDDTIQKLSLAAGRSLSGSGSCLPSPVLAYSHKGNPEESLMGPAFLICSPDDLTPDLIEEISHRCEGLPLTIASSVRCLIRELSMEDLPVLLKLQEENKKNPDGCFFPENCAAPDEFLLSYIRHQYRFYGYGLFGVFSKDTGQMMGIAGFSESNLANADALISYGLLKPFHHQGYAREAVGLLMGICKERWGIHSFSARIHPDNTASLRLAEDLGIPII